MNTLKRFFSVIPSFADALYAYLQTFLLPLLLIALGAMVAGNLGQGFGITYLFWDEVWYRQFTVGLVLGLGFAHLVFIGFLLDYGKWLERKALGDTTREGHWASELFLENDDSQDESKKLKRSSKLFLWYYYSFFVLTFGLALLFNRNYESLIAPGADLKTWPLIVGFIVTAGIGVYLLSRVGQIIAEKIIKREEDVMHFWAGVVFVLFVIAYVLVRAGRGMVPASVPVIVLFSLIGALYGFMSYAVSTWKLDGKISLFGFIEIPLPKANTLAPWIPPAGLIIALIVLIMLLIGGSQRYKYRFPGLALHYKTPLTLEEKAVTELPLLKPADIVMADARQTRPFVMVTTSGGGITAAAWTTAILSQLELETNSIITSRKML